MIMPCFFFLFFFAAQWLHDPELFNEQFNSKQSYSNSVKAQALLSRNVKLFYCILGE